MKKIENVSLRILQAAAIFLMVALAALPARAASSPAGSVKDGYYEITIPAGEGRTLQAALNEAHEKATAALPYKIILSKGDYPLDADLHIYSNTTLVATGAKIYFSSKEEGNLLKVGAQDDPVRGYGFENITVEGGVWDGRGKGALLMKACHLKNFTLHNVTLQNNYEAHMVEMAAVDGINITSCKFLNLKARKNNSANEAVQIDVLEDHHICGYKYINEDIDYLCKNIVIDHCTFDHCYRGVGAHTQVIGRYFENVKITNNTFTNLDDVAINCRAFKNAEISGNKVTTATRALDVTCVPKEGHGAFTSVSEPSISRNVTVPNCNIVVRDNVFTSTGDRAVQIMGAKFAKDTAVDVTEGGGSEVVTHTIPKGDYYINGVTLENNTITGKGDYTVRLNFGKNITIQNNIINATPTKSAMAVYDGGDYSNKIINNTIQGKMPSAIKLFAVDGTVCGKTVMGSISNNSIAQGAGENAISASNSSVANIDGNTIKNAKKAAILISLNSKVASICNNKITGTGYHAITSSGCSFGRIDGNTITNSGQTGINLGNNASATSISKNVITGAGYHGISASKSTVSNIDGNSVIKARKISINASGKASVKSISRNTVTGAGNHAVWIGCDKKYTIKVVSNKLSGKRSYTGIYASTGKVNITKNTLIGFGTGIRRSSGATGKIKKNKFKNCKKKM